MPEKACRAMLFLSPGRASGHPGRASGPGAWLVRTELYG